MSSYSSNLNPDVVQTALDKVFMQEFDVMTGPGQATVGTSDIFIQDTADGASVIAEVFKGSGLWEERGEEENVAGGTPKITNKITFIVTEFAKSIDIPKVFFDDNRHGAYEKMVRDFALKARITQNNNGFGLYRNAFTTTLTADGVAFISASHVTISGETVSNLVTGALTESTLEDANTAIREMKSQDGVVIGSEAATLLVPTKLYPEACRIVKSALRADTANNDMNVFSSIYNINVYTSPYLGAAAGGSDTAWFLLGRNHSVTRWVRQGIQLDLVPYKNQRNNNYIYKGSFREVVGVYDYANAVGSTGL
jgi:hypothetical protein